MLSILYYIFLVAVCTIFMILSAIALVVCYPFDRGRRVVHELSRVLVYIFWFTPPLWRVKVIGRELLDKRKQYVIVMNHNTVVDIPALYFIHLNFRWVSKREVFKVPFFGQFLHLHGDICIDRGRAAEAMAKLNEDGQKWISRGASIAIFPEGTRSKDGEIKRFKAGAFALAKASEVEILPVVLEGTRRAIKPNIMFKWRNTVTVRVLQPIPVEMVTATPTEELVEKTRRAMCEALDEIRDNNKQK